jgi:sec-independent protein translocase protein TatA
MAGLGMQELVVIMLVFVVLFGVKKLPEMGKNLGLGITNFKKAIKEIGRDVEVGDED